jgi:hypothetical protein
LLLRHIEASLFRVTWGYSAAVVPLGSVPRVVSARRARDEPAVVQLFIQTAWSFSLSFPASALGEAAQLLAQSLFRAS